MVRFMQLGGSRKKVGEGTWGSVCVPLHPVSVKEISRSMVVKLIRGVFVLISSLTNNIKLNFFFSIQWMTTRGKHLLTVSSFAV